VNDDNEPNVIPASTSDDGEYQIGYFVKDKAGNEQQEIVYRTVTVTDTLPPVITLKLNNKLVHNGGVRHAHRHGDTVDKAHIKDTGTNHYKVGGLSVEDYPHTRDSWGQDQQYPQTPEKEESRNYENGEKITTAKNAEHDFARDQKKYNQYNPAAYKSTNEYGTAISATGYKIFHDNGTERSFGNPNLSLMAESVSSHGWLVAAVASAVAGVALLGYSSRKSASISVPV